MYTSPEVLYTNGISPKVYRVVGMVLAYLQLNACCVNARGYIAYAGRPLLPQRKYKQNACNATKHVYTSYTVTKGAQPWATPNPHQLPIRYRLHR